jgi:hypothetical protein
MCIAHDPQAREASLQAKRAGGASKRRRELRVLPAETPPPDWSSVGMLRKWCEERAGQVEKGLLDKRSLPDMLARLVLETFQVEQLEALALEIQAIKATLRDRAEGRA